jgi:3-hydroxyacyl-[acyl-carrier-protein] dehydratase
MRWLWIDRFDEFTSGKTAVAVKTVTAAEEHVHDLYPGHPIFPNSLILEGFAQTAGILVGDAGQFREKVILAKVGRAEFHRHVRPGDRLTYHAKIDTFGEAGASCHGSADVDGERVMDVTMMFSHIDQNMSGLGFPEHNFVFTPQFLELLDEVRRGDADPAN